MQPHAEKVTTESRLAGASVDACRADVRAVATRLWPQDNSELDLALHRSISALLTRELFTLTRHDPGSRVLPNALHTWEGQWKATLARTRLEACLEQRAVQWRNAVIELLQRLACDWDALAQVFGLNPCTRPIRISAPLGDPHNHGRSVYRIDFDDQTSLIYKPRTVDGEHTFGRVVNWVRDTGFGLSLEMCRTLPRDRYGWTAFVEEEHADTTEEALRYFESQGAFLALFFLVCGSDCISDNVIVRKDRPVWIDTECVCSPHLIRDRLKVSLPDWMFDTAMSTLMVFSANEMGLPPRRNTGLGVSCMRERSLVFTEGDVLREPFIRAVHAGFRGLYEWVLERRDLWASHEGPMSWWAGQRIRVLPRPTSIYMRLIDLMRVAPDESMPRTREAVKDFLRSQGKRSWGDDTIDAEMIAIDRADVPYWTTSTDSRDLEEAGGAVARDVATLSGIEHLNDRMRQMSPAHLDTQLWLIESYLRVRVFP